MKLRLPYPPSTNLAWRHVRGRTLVSKAYRDFKRAVQREALVQLRRWEPLTGNVTMRVDVYRPRQIGDLSNRIKTLEDALIGIAFEDDAQVCEIHAVRHDDKANPRVEVEVSPFVPHD